MTRTALENRKIAESAAKRHQDKFLAAKDRQLQRDLGDQKAKAQIVSAGIGAVGKIGGEYAKGLGKGSMLAGDQYLLKAASLNDPEHYKRYIKNLESFVNIPTYDRLGNNVYAGRYLQIDALPYAGPGIMTFGWIPTCGNQSNSNTAYFRNPINQTLARDKEKILALNSRSDTDWEPSDLGFNEFCSSDILTMILDLGRVIKVYDTYNAENAYLARSLVTALGWDYSDIEDNYSEYRRTYVKLVSKFNSSVVAPKGLSLYERRIFLASNIFIDTDNASRPRQMYAYVQTHYFQLSDDGSFCNLLAVDRTSITNFNAKVMLAMEKITANPDFVTMYQDLRHAYGSNLIQLSDDYAGSVQFNNNPLNREQLHNVITVPALTSYADDKLHPLSFNASNFRLHQDTSGYLYQGSSSTALDRAFKSSALIYLGVKEHIDQFFGSSSGKQLFNMHKDIVSGDDILDITRWHFTLSTSETPDAEGSESGNVTCILTSCGTEVCTGFHIFTTSENSDIPTVVDCYTHNFVEFTAFSNDETNMTHVTVNKCKLTAFDWHPICTDIILKYQDALDIDLMHVSTYADIRTTFVINAANIAALNEACVMSELYLPDNSFVR